MTQPLGQGKSTWARTTKLADLEWGQPRKKLVAMFTATRVFPRYEGRNPRTGAPVIVPESVALPTEPGAGLHVHPSVTFDHDAGLATITLKSTYPRPPEATDEMLLAAANKVMAALDLDELTELPAEPKQWKHKGTQIVFERDDECFWFELSPLA
ncbi:MAG TPA: hypothetical protein VIU61_07425 [Kofleriaceae bacterium]